MRSLSSVSLMQSSRTIFFKSDITAENSRGSHSVTALCARQLDGWRLACRGMMNSSNATNRRPASWHADGNVPRYGRTRKHQRDERDNRLFYPDKNYQILSIFIRKSRIPTFDLSHLFGSLEREPRRPTIIARFPHFCVAIADNHFLDSDCV